MSGSTVHQVEIRKPVDILLSITLGEHAELMFLQFNSYGPMPSAEELVIHRALTFVQELVYRADKRLSQIELGLPELRDAPQFQIEHAVLKAVVETQAVVMRAKPQRYSTGGQPR